MDRIARVEPELSDVDQTDLDRSLLGALLYLPMNTYPDIAYDVGFYHVLALSIPKPHVILLRIMQYVRGTVSQGIQFSGSMFDMHTFTDAGWAGDILTRQSTTGYVVFAAGGPLFVAVETVNNDVNIQHTKRVSSPLGWM